MKPKEMIEKRHFDAAVKDKYEWWFAYNDIKDELEACREENRKLQNELEKQEEEFYNFAFPNKIIEEKLEDAITFVCDENITIVFNGFSFVSPLDLKLLTPYHIEQFCKHLIKLLNEKVEKTVDESLNSILENRR
jgi:hypothetical protein